MRRMVFALLSISVTALPAPASAARPLQRFALVVGANFGGPDRERLQYAVSDAERFARVMADLGGVSGANEILLRQPSVRELADALDVLTTRAADARRGAIASGAGRTEVIVYYSGHADEKGLLLGEDRYSYRTLRDKLDQVPADVRIVVLDACASGAFTRLKGGRRRPAFLVDESTDMRGHAFLTSSAATEAAQESDRIRSSYFTHYLVSGLRGAADLSGDGRITLNEAYQFAFNETLGGTVNTAGGAQHPSYDINMSGTGDVVMTDTRQTSATLVLAESLEGRFYVRNSAQELVVELYKPYGRRVELGLEPGAYEIRVVREKETRITRAQVADGGQIVLDPAQFAATTHEHTTVRGGGHHQHERFALAGRNRLSLLIGMRDAGGSGQVVTAGESAINALGGLEYTRFVTETLAITFAIDGFGAQTGATVTSAGAFSGDSAVAAMPVGVRWNPVRGLQRGRPIRPFVQASVGPVIGASDGAFASQGLRTAGSWTSVAAGGLVGGGIDFLVARGFGLTVDFGYNWMADFDRPIGGLDNYSGFGFTLGIGWLFGHGDAQP